eukprot:COSAG02_NODE_2074_length_9929_cov_698.467955_5_plen_385_part_00
MAAWACSACTYINEAEPNREICEICGTAKAAPVSEGSSVTSAAGTSSSGGGARVGAGEIDLSSVSEGALRAGASAADDQTLAQALQSSFDAEEASARNAAAAAEEAEGLARDVCWKLRRDVGTFVARAAKQLEVDKVEHNPASQPGQPLYERFKQAVDRASDKTIRLVFHGSPEQNMDAIAREGLDPKRRGSAVGQAYGAGEYFGTDVGTSLGYCQGGKKMLVFAVLCDPAGVTNEVDLGGGGIRHAAARKPAATQSASGRVLPAVASQFFSPKHQKRLAQPGIYTAGAPLEPALSSGEEKDAPPGPGILVINKSDYQLPLCVIHLQLGAWSNREMERRKAVVRERILRKRQLQKQRLQTTEQKQKRARVTENNEVVLLSSDDE